MARNVSVSQRGVRIDSSLDAPVVVLFDDHPVWFFNPARDTVRGLVRWPSALVPFLDGVTRVVVREHGSGEEFFDDEVSFGSAGTRIAVVDANGHQVSVDKAGHLQRNFARTDDDTRQVIMDAVERVLADLRDCGVEAFLAYGCLLGAVRTGHMIGHDSDADLSYYSRHEDPFDIALENHRVERAMRGRGWHVVRMSAADFKVWIPLEDGRRVGIDVFTSFHIGDHFHLMSNLRGPLPREAVLPLSTVTLEGREVPAPADPAAVLALTYGPGWATPDPSFRFQHPRSSIRRMGGWWRGARRDHRHWLEHYRSTARARNVPPPSPFAEWVAERLEPGSAVLDCGCGDARDTKYFAQRGHEVTAVDYVGRLGALVGRVGTRLGNPIGFLKVNFNELESVLVGGAQVAWAERPTHVYARFLVDSLDGGARRDFWRFARMVQRRGGLTFLEFRTTGNGPRSAGPHPVYLLDPAVVAREVQERKGVVLHREVGRGLAGKDNDVEVCRMIVRWDR